MGIARVRAFRIAPQIGPIGRRRVDRARPAPRNRFTSDRDDGTHALGHGIAWIGVDELDVAIQRVALERQNVRFLRIEIAQWPRAYGCGLLGRNGRWRRIGGALEEHNGRLYLPGVPWHFGAAGQIVYAQPGALEYAGKWKPPLAEHLGERLRVRPVGALAFGSNRPGRGIEGNEQPWLGLDQRKAACDRRA